MNKKFSRFDEKYIAPADSKIYLDDLREPPDQTWMWVTTVKAAIGFLNQGNVKTISLDHDLGMTKDTGYDVLKWIEEKVFTDDKYEPPIIMIHTQNPVAEKTMSAARNRIYERVGKVF